MDKEKKTDSPAPSVDYNDGRVTFYYSRERRLEKASPEVRLLNEQTVLKRQGLFRTLTATKPRMFTFLSIITICAAIVLFSLLKSDSRARILDTEIVVSAVKGGDKSYITLKKTVTGPDPYTGAVAVAVSPENSVETLYRETLYFSLENEEVYRFIAPVTGKTLLILAVLDSQPVLLKTNPR
ncbi:MAG: hypothetical protein LBI67_07380 [Treponema sp.]|jgi:hypothetical protein|nr:hypothetical protein [Treponema sp.]